MRFDGLLIEKAVRIGGMYDLETGLSDPLYIRAGLSRHCRDAGLLAIGVPWRA